jgi:hypothetical protein
MENLIQENLDLRNIVAKLNADNIQLKTTLAQARINCATRLRTYILRDSRLPEPCVKRLNAAFAKSTDNSGLKEAINAERKLVGAQ